MRELVLIVLFLGVLGMGLYIGHTLGVRQCMSISPVKTYYM